MPTYDVSCSFCGTKNRVPADKEGKLGRCGSCHRELPPMYYRPQQLTERTFDTFIRGYHNLMLAEFWAPWCPHCVAFAPTVQKVAGMLAGETAVAQINSEENPSLAQRFGVTGIPLLLLLREGKDVDRLPGAQSSEAIIRWFRGHR